MYMCMYACNCINACVKYFYVHITGGRQMCEANKYSCMLEQIIRHGTHYFRYNEKIMLCLCGYMRIRVHVMHCDVVFIYTRIQLEADKCVKQTNTDVFEQITNI